MLKSGRTQAKGCSFDGCSCHNTKDQRRKGKRPAKRAEERAWRKEAGA